MFASVASVASVDEHRALLGRVRIPGLRDFSPFSTHADFNAPRLLIGGAVHWRIPQTLGHAKLPPDDLVKGSDFLQRARIEYLAARNLREPFHSHSNSLREVQEGRIKELVS